MFEHLLSAGLKLFGMEQDRAGASDRQRLVLEDKEKDRELQREFAQSGIQWRAADAAKAGINPHFAIGGGGATYTPSAISLGSGPSMSEALGGMGQDVTRAINATRTAEQRDDAFTKTVQSLDLKRKGLENDLLAAQIAKLRAGSNPPMPTASSTTDTGPVPEAAKFEDRKRLRIGGDEISTDPRTTNAQDFEDRYGETSDWLYGPAIMWQDYVNTMGGAYSRAAQNPFDPGYGKNPGSYWWRNMLRRLYESRPEHKEYR